MKQVEIEVKIGVLRRELTYWESVLQKRSCGECINYSEKVCRLAGIAPPSDVQATGCPEYEWDDIPF